MTLRAGSDVYHSVSSRNESGFLWDYLFLPLSTGSGFAWLYRLFS